MADKLEESAVPLVTIRTRTSLARNGKQVAHEIKKSANAYT
jgi:hypothetical protein